MKFEIVIKQAGWNTGESLHLIDADSEFTAVAKAVTLYFADGAQFCHEATKGEGVEEWAVYGGGSILGSFTTRNVTGEEGSHWGSLTSKPRRDGWAEQAEQYRREAVAS